MLSRRYLRIKAFQALYAFRQREASERELAISAMREQFSPDLNSLDPQDKVTLARQADFGERLLRFEFEGTDPQPRLEGIEGEPVEAATQQQLANFQVRVGNLRKEIRKQASEDLERIEAAVVTHLLVWGAVCRHAEVFAQKQRDKKIQRQTLLPGEEALGQNWLAKAFDQSVSLNLAADKLHVLPQQVERLARLYYEETFRVHATTRDLLIEPQPTEEVQRQMAHQSFKKVMGAAEKLDEYFDEQDPQWSENQHIVRGIVVRWAKDQPVGEPFEYHSLAQGQAADLEFYDQLLAAALADHPDIEKRLEAQLHNWELERVALTDQVLLRLAIEELCTFAQIPVKVTLNEYIELAKTYSTPKSKQFVNGLLDALNVSLQADGKIKKSGRGLLDA